MYYLIDTNILIYFVNREIPKSEFIQVKTIIQTSFNISVMTKIELLGWQKLEKENIVSLNKLIAKSNLLTLNDEITEQAISLKQQMNLKTPDAIIAATAIVNNLVLVTRNKKDFNKIINLEIYNPFEGFVKQH